MIWARNTPTAWLYFSKVIGTLSKTVENDDDNVGKAIRPITEDKKCTWLCEIMLTFVPSCSHMRRQFLHFHVVCKTWSIFSFRKRCLKQQHTHKHRYYYKLLQSLYMDMISSRISFHGETGLNVSYLKAVVKKRKRGIHSIFRQDSKLNNESTVSVSTNGLLICNSHKT